MRPRPGLGFVLLEKIRLWHVFLRHLSRRGSSSFLIFALVVLVVVATIDGIELFIFHSLLVGVHRVNVFLSSISIFVIPLIVDVRGWRCLTVYRVEGEGGVLVRGRGGDEEG